MPIPRPVLAILLLVGLVGPVVAAAPLPKLGGRTILASCRQGECRWLRIAEVASVSKQAQGELRRMRARAGLSYHPNGDTPKSAARTAIEWERSEQVDYAFCSTKRPAYGFSDRRGGLVVHYFDLFDLAGYQYATAAKACRPTGRCARSATARAPEASRSRRRARRR
jgi:hypothetical protein